MTLPANSPQRDRGGELVEAGYRCSDPECDRAWIIIAVHGEPSDGSDPRTCRYCGAPNGVRTR